MQKREFVVRLKNQKNNRLEERLVKKLTFAEAASEAYRFHNNLQFGNHPEGNWKIVSVVEVDLIGA